MLAIYSFIQFQSLANTDEIGGFIWLMAGLLKSRPCPLADKGHTST